MLTCLYALAAGRPTQILLTGKKKIHESISSPKSNVFAFQRHPFPQLHEYSYTANKRTQANADQNGKQCMRYR